VAAATPRDQSYSAASRMPVGADRKLTSIQMMVAVEQMSPFSSSSNRVSRMPRLAWQNQQHSCQCSPSKTVQAPRLTERLSRARYSSKKL
jgi:hypothetical protein